MPEEQGVRILFEAGSMQAALPLQLDVWLKKPFRTGWAEGVMWKEFARRR
jgi:hypothetical protein